MDVHALVLANLPLGDYSMMVLYLLAVMGIGVWFSRGKSDTESYLLGGRNMPWWLIGISYVVSLLSTLTMVGVPGEAYCPRNGSKTLAFRRHLQVLAFLIVGIGMIGKVVNEIDRSANWLLGGRHPGYFNSRE